VNYQKKLKGYGVIISNKKTLKFVNFLKTLFEWMDILVRDKRLSPEQKKEVLKHAPKKIFEDLDLISPTVLSQSGYDELKIVLDEEAMVMINFIVEIGSLRMSDFDLLQFNLYQIFGKEELASMVEHTRERISEKIRGSRSREIEETEKKEKAEQEYFKKIKDMTKEELKKFVVSSMFDFTPSARTPSERLNAIKKNLQRVKDQKLKFRNFEVKLVDATVEAREGAQSKVYRQIRTVKTGMTEITERFREKASVFVSEEGPKKKIKEAGNRIVKAKEKLHDELMYKGKDWEKHFSRETDKAGMRILVQQKKLHKEIKGKGKEWKQHFGSEATKARDKIAGKRKGLDIEINVRGQGWIRNFSKAADKARGKIDKKTFNLIVAEKQKEKSMKEKGKTELEGARERLILGKAYFEEDVETAKGTFSGKAAEIDSARRYFTEKRDFAEHSFLKKGSEAESEIYRTLFKERKRFKKERDEARERFKTRASEIKGQGKAHISGKKEKFAEQKARAGSKFSTRASEIKGQPIMQVTMPEIKGKNNLATTAEQAKGKIEQEHLAMMDTAKVSRDKMMKEVVHRRDLFLYDTRFAKHNIQENAKQFAEKVSAKREEFETRGKQIVSRHKARQKAHLIRNLLRTIRTVQVR
jgi:hypothetical protein